MIKQVPIKNILLQGTIGGLIAGLVFALAQMAFSAMLDADAWLPIRLFASIGLGAQALNPSYPMVNILLVGFLIHALLSAIYGIVFFLVLVWAREFRNTTGMLILYGILYGILLWATNFYWIAPIYFPQFIQLNQIWNGVVVHAIAYGAVLGAYAAAIEPSRALEDAPRQTPVRSE